MPASPAFAIDCVSGFIRIGRVPVPDGPHAHPLVRALGPALETAFGLEHAALFPDAIAVLIARLHSGPLGSGTGSWLPRPAESVLEAA